jgi:SAM-dependent methyltransferase
MHSQNKFWDVLAAHHAALENNFLELGSLRRIMGDVRSPVLVVGAGHGLLVAELQSRGYQCAGVDFSSEMIKHAKSRRGLDIIQADASALPLGNATYETIIYATGVIDFNGDENAILNMLHEGRRVVKPGGKILVAFYRFSPALEDFLTSVGLLSDSVVLHRRSLEMSLLTAPQMFRWVRQSADTGWLGAAGLMFRLAAFGTLREKVTSLKMQRIVRKMGNAQAFIQAASETQPYRNEGEIRKLFDRMNIPIQGFRSLATCCIAEL